MYAVLVKLLAVINLTPDDVIALFKGLIVALLGAALTYGQAWVMKTDFGANTPFVVAGWSLIVNIIRKIIDKPVLDKTGIQL